MGLAVGGSGRQDGGVILGVGETCLEPALTHRFLVGFPQVPSGLSNDFQVPQHNKMNFAVRDFQPGKKVVEGGSYELANRTIRYPLKRAALPQVSLNLIVFGGLSNPAYNFFWKWFKMVYKDEDDTIGLLLPGGGCGGTVKVDLLAPDETVIASAIAEDAWPCSFSVGDLTRKDEAEAVIASVGFEVNAWEWSEASNSGTGGGPPPTMPPIPEPGFIGPISPSIPA